MTKRIAVVGAGVFGSWIARLAVRAGFETTLIDQYGPANALSSSTGSSRIIRRAYGADEIYTLFAQRSLEMWTAFFTEENRSDCFRRTDVLWMAKDSDASIHAARGIFQRHQLKHEFLDAHAIRVMEVPPGTVALFEPDCGALMAETSVRIVAESAIRGGARYVNDRVEPLQTDGPLHFLKTAGGERIEADVFVFAAGSWLPRLWPEVLGKAIFPTRQEIFFFELPAGRSLPIWVDQTDPRVPYGFPDIDGAGIKVAFHRTGPEFDPEYGMRRVGREQIAEATAYLRSRFPAMRGPVFRVAQVCHYENTSNGDFLIDRHPAAGNVWFAGGGSGHGFKHGPAVAEYLLAAIERGCSPEPRFRLAGKGQTLAKHVI